jgi:CRP-like cAMP-binding protein
MSISEFFKTIFFDKETKEKVKFFKKLKLFNDLSDRAVYKLMDIMYTKTYPANEIIFNEGDVGKAVFILKSGEVVITKMDKKDKQERILSRFSTGDFFGEMALLEEMPRSATARTVQESEIVFIYKVRFDALLEHYPSGGAKVVHNLAKMLSARLRKTSEEYVKND